MADKIYKLRYILAEYSGIISGGVYYKNMYKHVWMQVCGYEFSVQHSLANICTWYTDPSIVIFDCPEVSVFKFLQKSVGG